MKTKIPEKIETKEEAEAFLLELHRNGEAYHPDDDAHEILWKDADVSKKDRNALNKTMDQIYALGVDPCEILCDINEDLNRC